MMDEQQREDKKWEKRQRKRLALREANIGQFLQASLTTMQGQDFFYWLLEICHIGRTPFTTNALTTAEQCGEQNIGYQVQTLFYQHAPEAYFQMLAAREKERLNDARPDPADDNDDAATSEPDPD